MPMQLAFLSITAGGLLLASVGQAEDFALQDGDTVVFLGDSITAARTYGTIVENYTLLRYPQRRVKFYNAGWGGDTAAGGAARLERDVFSRGATVLAVAYGLNDIGWGVKADAEHKRKYLDAIRDIVVRCRERNIRVFICSAAITSEDPDKAERGFLQKMCDEGLALSRELGGGAIDVQRSMRAVQRRALALNEKIRDQSKHTRLHAADGAHLNDLGQLAMAFAIIKGLGAPADVSSAQLDFASGAVLEATGCRISDIAARPEGLEFTRLDEGLPINFGLFGALQFVYVPFHSELNGYLLTVKNLPPGKYEVSADGRSIARYTHGQLAQGVNIASATTNAWQPGGPWDAQSSVLKAITEARSQLGVAGTLWNAYLEGSPRRPDIREQAAKADLELQELQRLTARPMPYRFRVRPVADESR
jgi:lysophospholipase L1-like esterase